MGRKVDNMLKKLCTNENIAIIFSIMSLFALYKKYTNYIPDWVFKDSKLALIVIFATSAWLAYKTMKINNILAWCFIIMATLFNPIIKVSFAGKEWRSIIIVSVIVYLGILIKNNYKIIKGE